MRTAARVTISLIVALLSGYWTFWGVLRHLAAPIEAQYGPNVFREDAHAGVTMGLYMIYPAAPLALLSVTVVFIATMIVSGQYWRKFSSKQI